MLRRNTPYGNIIYMLRLLENDRKTSFLTDLFSRSRYKGYNFLMEDTRKGYLLSKIVYLRVTKGLDVGAKPLRTITSSAVLAALRPRMPASHADSTVYLNKQLVIAVIANFTASNIHWISERFRQFYFFTKRSTLLAKNSRKTEFLHSFSVEQNAKLLTFLSMLVV